MSTTLDASTQILSGIIALLSSLQHATAEELRAIQIAEASSEFVRPALTEPLHTPQTFTPASAFVPFVSQFDDITSELWKGRSCGIASIAMIMNYYVPHIAEANTLLKEGIDAGAYIDQVGWSHAGLIGVSERYGFTGSAHDLKGAPQETALARFRDAVATGPVIASVHYTFDPENPIPHLVVITGIDGTTVHYNDPAEKTGGGTIPLHTFVSAWKQRYIEIRPA